MNKINKLYSYSMQELAPIVCEFLQQGKRVILRAKGNSMLPLIRNLKDRVVLSAISGENCSVGDAVMFSRDNGTYVLHRIVDRDHSGNFVLMGDGQTEREEGIRPDQIIAKMIGFYRKSRYFPCEAGCCKIYARFWTNSTLCRKVYLKLIWLYRTAKSKIKKLIG